MAEFKPKEKASGSWNGQDIHFTREWAGHRFTDDEVNQLLAGDTIHITAHSAAKDKDFECDGKLAKQSYNGHDFVGFQPDFG